MALTGSEPGLRYSAHLKVLAGLGLDLVCIEISGWGCTAEKIIRQCAILRRRGVTGYLRWRRKNQSGKNCREEVGRYLEQCFGDEDGVKFQPAIRRSFSGFSGAAVKFIEKEKPDLLFQLGVGLIPGHFIKRVPTILNLHPGILPGIRGLDPLFWAHYYGREEWVGSTLHIVEEKIDAGPPLLRRRFAPSKGRHYAESVRKQVYEEGALIRDFFSNYPAGYEKYDMGGGSSSIYRGLWSEEQYKKLRAVNWWAAEELG